jgi:hypothetical protein
MGPAGLTAVFGMGTGVTPPVWSPEKYPTGGQAGRARWIPRLGRTRSDTILGSGRQLHVNASKSLTLDRTPVLGAASSLHAFGQMKEGGSVPIGVVKLLGC